MRSEAGLGESRRGGGGERRIRRTVGWTCTVRVLHGPPARWLPGINTPVPQRVSKARKQTLEAESASLSTAEIERRVLD